MTGHKRQPRGASPTNRGGAHTRAKLHECTRHNIGRAHITDHIWRALRHATTGEVVLQRGVSYARIGIQKQQFLWSLLQKNELRPSNFLPPPISKPIPGKRKSYLGLMEKQQNPLSILQTMVLAFYASNIYTQISVVTST